MMMLLKGCKKNLIALKNIGSDYIEEAYLILKPDLPRETAKGDIVKEANRLIHEYDTGRRKKRRPFSLPSFFLGAMLASAVLLLLFFLL
jgi:hypothetical protein